MRTVWFPDLALPPNPASIAERYAEIIAREQGDPELISWLGVDHDDYWAFARPDRPRGRVMLALDAAVLASAASRALELSIVGATLCVRRGPRVAAGSDLFDAATRRLPASAVLLERWLTEEVLGAHTPVEWLAHLREGASPRADDAHALARGLVHIYRATERADDSDEDLLWAIGLLDAAVWAAVRRHPGRWGRLWRRVSGR